MYVRLFWVFLVLTALVATSGQAALSRYTIRQTKMTDFSGTSPRIDVLFANSLGPPGTTVIDNDGGSGSPILLRHVEVSGGPGTTVSLPSLSGFIFVKDRFGEGPSGDQTGTGDVSSTIDWGIVSSWTASGGRFCNSVPATICGLAAAVDDETFPASVDSSKFDFHSWVFHATGFRAPEGYISNTGRPSPGSTDRGNLQVFYRGALRPNGTVPALPLIGMGAVGLSIAAMGLSALRRRR